jgi:hypothetical protein
MIDETIQNGAAAPSEAGRPSSLVARLRHERDERIAERTLDLAIPTWSSDDGYGLIVRLRALTFAEAQPLNRRAMVALAQGSDASRSREQERKASEDEMRVWADSLVRACVDVRISTPSGDTMPLDETPAAEPCRFDARTCGLLSLGTPSTAREAVMLVYRRNEWAVRDAWGELQAFTTGARTEETEQLLGETER